MDPVVNQPFADLSAFKPLTEAEKKKLAEAGKQMFVSNGLMCSCGEKITDQGVTLFMYRVGPVPTAQGIQLGVQLITSNFHSRSCKSFQEATGEAPEGFIPICVRDLPHTEWLAEIDFSNESNRDRSK